MAKVNGVRDRLSIDVRPEEHRQIKAYAALHGQSIREYVLDGLRERLRRDSEQRVLADLTGRLEQDAVLKALWDNPKDAAYDRV